MAKKTVRPRRIQAGINDDIGEEAPHHVPDQVEIRESEQRAFDLSCRTW